MEQELTHAVLTAWLGTRFGAGAEDTGEVELELAEVSGLSHSSGVESFSVLFHGPMDQALPQGLYELGAGQAASFSLFLVPVGRREDTIVYEAVFSRLVSE